MADTLRLELARWPKAAFAGQIAVLALIYFLAAKASMTLAIPPGYATALWPPSGIALAAVLLLGRRIWPGIWIGAALANLTVQGLPLLAAGIGTGNTLEAVVAAALVRPFINRRGEFDSGEAVVIFSFASALSAFIAAIIGTLCLILAGSLPLSAFSSNAWTWFQGDVSGMVIVAPLLLAWRWRKNTAWPITKWIEAVVLALALVLVSLIIFDIGFQGGLVLPMAFATLPFVVWTAIRFEQRSTMAAIAAISAIAVWSTAQGKGPFATGSAEIGSLLLLGYTGTLVITGLVLSAVMGQRDRAVGAVHQRVEELQERERQLNEFLAMLSHELRNPLAPMVNAIAVIRKSPGHTPEQMLSIVERQVAHLSHIVDDLLDVSRITRGKILLDRKTVDLNEIVSRVLEERHGLIAARGHKVDSQLAPEAVFIQADPTRISQVALNLINNAAKYTPAGGHIRITVARENNQAILRVRDSGIGIAPELLPRIFDLFTQGDRSLDRSEGGLGIGLTIARRLIEMHEGTIEAASNGPGQGSEFIVRLPVQTAPKITNEATDLQQPGKPRRLLVVDDHQEGADTLATLLRIMGHDVRTAYDGREAIKLAAQFHPHAVLLDIGLPGMNGYEVAAELKTFRQNPMVLIAVSGYGQDEDRRRSSLAGFDRHLVKPVDPAKLVQIIDGLEIPDVENHQTGLRVGPD